MNLWCNTIGYGGTATKLGYLSEEQNVRLERIRVARMLWKGQHRQCFLQEGRTQFDFPKMRVQGVITQPYVTLNILKLVSTTVTDLLLGAEPLLRIEGQGADQQLRGLLNRSSLHRRFYEAACQASWAAEAMVEVVRWNGQAYVNNVKPSEFFPLGQPNPDGQYSAFRRYATAMSSEISPRPLLLEVTYSAGLIERACFFLDGGEKKGDAGLSLWPAKNADGSDLVPREATGIDACTILWTANETDEGTPTSDYDGLIELQDELNHKQTQIARVIAKHADPKLAVPQSMVSPNGDISARHDVLFFRSKDELPSYVTWNAELASAIADRDFTLNALCIAAELSPVLLGIRQGATPDAARKLRLEATKSLARAGRKATFIHPFIRRAIDMALALEAAGNRVMVPVGGPVSLELRDGLPVDELDEAQTLSMLTGGKAVMSLERAVEKQLPDPEAAAKEIARLKAQAAEATPSILLGREPGEERRGDGENGRMGEGNADEEQV